MHHCWRFPQTYNLLSDTSLIAFCNYFIYVNKWKLNNALSYHWRHCLCVRKYELKMKKQLGRNYIDYGWKLQWRGIAKAWIKLINTNSDGHSLAQTHDVNRWWTSVLNCHVLTVKGRRKKHRSRGRVGSQDAVLYWQDYISKQVAICWSVWDLSTLCQHGKLEAKKWWWWWWWRGRRWWWYVDNSDRVCIGDKETASIHYVCIWEKLKQLPIIYLGTL